MLKGSDEVIAWLESQHIGNWKLYRGNTLEDGKLFMESSEAARKNPAEGIEELKNTLAWLQPGYYSLKIKNSNEDLSVHWNKGFYSTNFELKAQPGAAVPAIAGLPAGYVEKSEVEKLITNAIATERRERELAEALAKVKELEGKTEGGLSKIGSFLESITPHAPLLGPVINNILSSFLPKQAPAMGNLHATGMEEVTPAEIIDGNLQDRLTKALEILSNGEEEAFVLRMEKLAEIRKTNPAFYSTICGMLDAQKI